MPARLAVVADFDGTVVVGDTGVIILQRFAMGDWQYYEEMYDKLEMPVEEVMKRQFAMVRATEKEMISAAESGAKLRPGFKELVEECRERRVPLEVASYGLDFCIKKLLEKIPGSGTIEVFAPETRITTKGITFKFSEPFRRGSTDLKLNRVRHHRQKGERVLFVGDGPSDLPAIREADIRFAIRGSRLAELCHESSIGFRRISTLRPVIEVVRQL